MEQQAPAAAGQQGDFVQHLRPDEAQALERVLVQLAGRLESGGGNAKQLGLSARCMVLAAFRPSSTVCP